jgi:hypothetical protein
MVASSSSGAPNPAAVVATFLTGSGHLSAMCLSDPVIERGFVEFSLTEKGRNPIVTRKFANVGKGALALFQAGDITTTGAAGD